MKAVTAYELAQMLAGPSPVRLVDILPEESFERVHLPGAESIPYPHLESRAEERLGRGEKIVVYGANVDCWAGRQAARRLERLGYADIYGFEGGIAAWSRAGYELVCDRQAALA